MQSVQRQIDEIAENIDGDEVIGRKRPVKTWTKRPDNWVDIVEEANLFGSSQTIRSFYEEFEGQSEKASFKKINRRQKDFKAKKTYFKVRIIPVYGSVIDNFVLLDFQRRRAQ